MHLNKENVPPRLAMVSRASASGVALRVCCVFVLGGVSAARCPAQDNRGSTVLVLKDPTPRQPDLDKVYGATQPAEASSAAKLPGSYNVRRWELITRASGQVEQLAATLDRSVAAHKPGTPFGQEVQVAGLIETLAVNIHSALAPKTGMQNGGAAPSSSPVADKGAERGAALQAEAARLSVLARDLRAEVGKSSPDILAVGVIERSSQVAALAHALKQDMTPK